MAHIIGLTTIDGAKVMVNADHIIYWEKIGGSIPHLFKPYANNRHLCVEELPDGDTCNEVEDDHAYTHVHLTGGDTLIVREDIYEINERIDVIQAALETWANDE